MTATYNRQIPAVIFFLALLLAFSVTEAADMEYVSGRVPFSVNFRELPFNNSLMSIFVLPSEKLNIRISPANALDSFIVMAPENPVEPQTAIKFRWIAPAKPGLYRLAITQKNGIDTMHVNVIVVIPFNDLKGDYLNGYKIGKYPKSVFRQLDNYKPPRGFVEITPENKDIFLSPHFKLEQFICKQESGYPKYAVLKTSLLVKLELILDKMNEKGYPCQTFNIMSGYRTPYYNKAIGNVKYSRHQWGDAADIFIDENPKDNMMDDLNKDGRINWKDAAVIYDIIDNMYGKKFYEKLIGGLGRYKKTNNHGPFVHVDTRGYHARWGY